METRGTCALIKLGYGMKFLLKSFDALHCFFYDSEGYILPRGNEFL